MATTTAETGPAPGTERLRRLSLTQRILARPAAGALIIVVFVWLVFAAISLAKGNLAFIAARGRSTTSTSPPRSASSARPLPC